MNNKQDDRDNETYAATGGPTAAPSGADTGVKGANGGPADAGPGAATGGTVKDKPARN
jgi:hypothetical protein